MLHRTTNDRESKGQKITYQMETRRDNNTQNRKIGLEFVGPKQLLFSRTIGKTVEMDTRIIRGLTTFLLVVS